MEVPLKRPSNKESDEDLLEQQELFLKEKVQPSVKLVKEENVASQVQIPHFKEQDDTVAGELCLENPVESCVQLDIKEHFEDFTKPFTFEAPISVSSLPQTRKISSFSQKKNKSIFAQKQDSKCVPECSYHQDFSLPSSSSLLVDGSGLASNSKDMEMQKIHEENLAKISGMSKEEILEHQTQLQKQLSPGIIDFIRSQKKVVAGKTNDVKSKGPNTVKSDTSQPCSSRLRSETSDSAGTVIRKEGRDCDAVLLEKALTDDYNSHIPVRECATAVGDGTPKGSIELPEETQELLENSNKGRWLNMSKVEKEKLEWMTKLPQPKPIDLKTGHVARFDFEGKPLSREADTPVTRGLHHHSSEPEVAGYSLEELFLLSRSTLQSQRITALQTISRILENYWYGKLDACFDSPLLPIFLEAGIVPLLRWALDDTTATSISVAVSAIHSLLVCKADEICLDRTFFWLNGHILPQLEPKNLEQDEVLEELTDADLIKLDVVKGWLRIDILPRFMYLLELPVTPPPSVCQLMLEICTRLAQHSTESAQKIACHPGFLKMVFKKFLPVSWPCFDFNQWTNATNFVYPMHSAMKLLRIIASSHKELALLLINSYDLLDSLRCYLTMQPHDGSLPMKDVQKLMVESLKTWQIFLTYGLAAEIYIDLFPIFVRQFEFCQSLSLNYDIKKHICDFEYATAFFKALEAVIVVASDPDSSISNSSYIITWDHVGALLKNAENCLKKWLFEFSRGTPSMVPMDLLSSCLNFIATFYRKSHKNLICEDSYCSIASNQIFKDYLHPFLLSETFKNLVKDTRSFSVVLSSPFSEPKTRDAKTLISLNTISWRDDVIPILKEKSPFPLLLAVLNYVNVHTSLFSDKESKVLEFLLCHPSVIEYLKYILLTNPKCENWFARFEIHFVCQMVELSTQTVQGNFLYMYRLTTVFLPCFKMCDEWLLKELLENMVFSQRCLLYPLDKSSPRSLNYSDDVIVQATKSRLPIIANFYISFYLDSNNVKNLQCLFQRYIPELDSIAYPICSKQILHKNWSYLPIFDLYQNMKTRQRSEGITKEDVSNITNCLQWTHTCTVLNLTIFKSVPLSERFFYLNLVFLLDADVFREDSIKQLLKAHLLRLLKDERRINIDRIEWDNTPPFEELYPELLTQFESVSYGDHLFGNYILIPLQQMFCSRWKKILLSEHSQTLSFLSVPFAELVVPVTNYLEPPEKDYEVLAEYFRVLSTGLLNSKRCPLLYLMAIHHLHQFIFMEPGEHLDYQKLMIRRVLKMKRFDSKRHILLYTGYSQEAMFGFDMRTDLLPDDRKHLTDVCDIPIQI